MLTKQKKEKIDDVAKKYGLKLLLLFGSQVQGKTNFDSDFDIAYLPKKSLDGGEEIEMNCDLMDVFQTDKIDQVNIKRANPLLLYEISRNSKLLFGEEMEYLEFKARAFRIYIESQSLFELKSILIKKRQRLLRQSIYA